VRALVLCGGFGTRLGALTASRPKPLLPVGAEPLVGHLLARLARADVREVGLNLHFLGEQLREALGDGARYGVQLRYLPEPELLGTAGSVRQNADWLFERGPALLCYGDVLSDHPLGELCLEHARHGPDVTLLVHPRPGGKSAALIDASGRISRFWERPAHDPLPPGAPRWSFSGVAVLSPSLTRWIPPGVADLPAHVLAPHVPELHARAVPHSGFRVAVDSPERLALAEQALADGRLQDAMRPRQAPDSAPPRG
jgi:NDP-sugar pyrophosphorylase family protein